MQAKISIGRKELKASLELLAMAQMPKPSLPIIDYMRFVVKNGNIVIVSTGLEISMKLLVDKTDQPDFEFIIDPKGILGIISKSSETTVVLSFGDAGMTLYEGLTGEYFFPKLANPHDFPVFPKVEGETYKVVLKGDKLKKALQTSEKFIGPESSQHAFGRGVSISNSISGLNIFTTNSHIMNITRIDNALDRFPGVIISKKLAIILKKLLVDAPVVFSMNPQNTLIQIGNVALHARNMEGKIPDYERIMPVAERSIDILEVDRLKFAEIIDKSSIVSDRIAFEVKESILTVSSHSVELSRKASNKITVGRLKNTDYSGMFNAELMMNILSVVETENIQLEVYPFPEKDYVYTLLYRNQDVRYLIALMDPSKS